MALMLAVVSGALPAAEPGFPSRPLRLVVAFAAGNGNDLVAREIAAHMAEDLAQPVVVENRVGAGGIIGTEAVVKAPPDGYTMGFGTSSQLVMNVGFYKRLPYDPDRDLASVGLVSRTPLVLAASAKGPATLADLIERARANPGEISYGSAGGGSITHIVAEAFQRRAQVQLTHVPYKGNGPALSDLMGGHVDLLFGGLIVLQPLAGQGSVRLLAISGRTRSKRAPDVPTFAEAGLPDYEASTWSSLVVPARTPQAIVDRLNVALNKALAHRATLQRLEEGESESLGPSTPAQAAAFTRNERARWVPLIRSFKLNGT